MKNSSETLRRRAEKRKVFRETTDLSRIPKTIIKKCKICGLPKPCRWDSSFYMDGTPSYRARCIDCNRGYFKKIRQRSSKRVDRNAVSRRRKRKQKYIEYLGGKCGTCGYLKSNKALSFHHNNPTEKEFTLSRILDYSWDKVKRELDKCVLLCMNCHMEEEERLDELRMDNR